VSDSTSEKLAVMVIMGGAAGRSSELDLSAVKMRRAGPSLMNEAGLSRFLRIGGDPMLMRSQFKQELLLEGESSGDGSDMQKTGTTGVTEMTGGGLTMAACSMLLCSFSKRVKLELMMFNGGGLLLINEGDAGADDGADGGADDGRVDTFISACLLPVGTWTAIPSSLQMVINGTRGRSIVVLLVAVSSLTLISESV